MAGEERERNFEKALARNLRPDPSAEAQPHTCPDAELLAAYHERSLPPEQMISWKGHIARCSRCQQVLAQLEATDEIPVDVNQEEYQGHNVLTMKEPDLPVLAPVAVPASTPAAPQTFDATKSPERRRKPRRAANWRWLAPAGAIAAGLLLWVAFHENGSQRFEMAKNQPTPVAAPAAPLPSSLPSPAARRSEFLEPKHAETTRSPLPALSQPGDAEAQKKPAGEENFKAALKKEAPVAPADKTKIDGERDRLAEKALPMSGRNVTDLNELSSGRLDAKKDAQEFKKQAGVAANAPAQDALPPVSGVAGAALSSPAPAKSAQDEVATDAAKEPPASAAETVTVQTQAQVVNGVSRSSTTAEVVRLARSQSPTMVAAPNGKTIWRVEAAGIVQRSTDAGSEWTLQKSGVLADLTAGSAPSDKVCWIVGHAGTILRTTDGGAHWLKVRSPIADDLSAVFAVDAQQATVSATSNHKSYKTLDGGLTWSPLPNP
jgi:hypothetical protein